MVKLTVELNYNKIANWDNAFEDPTVEYSPRSADPYILKPKSFFRPLPQYLRSYDKKLAFNHVLNLQNIQNLITNPFIHSMPIRQENEYKYTMPREYIFQNDLSAPSTNTFYRRLNKLPLWSSQRFNRPKSFYREEVPSPSFYNAGIRDTFNAVSSGLNKLPNYQLQRPQNYKGNTYYNSLQHLLPYLYTNKIYPLQYSSFDLNAPRISPQQHATFADEQTRSGFPTNNRYLDYYTENFLKSIQENKVPKVLFPSDSEGDAIFDDFKKYENPYEKPHANDQYSGSISPIATSMFQLRENTPQQFYPKRVYLENVERNLKNLIKIR